MEKTINLQDKDGLQFAAVKVCISGDTVDECEETMRTFNKDCEAWKKYALKAVKDGTTADGSSRSLVGKVAMQLAEQKLKKLIDDTFGVEVYPAFFSMGRPFAAVNGRFYCAVVLDTLNEIIKQMIGGMLTDE